MKDRFLLIMRHAKSDWSIGGQPDFERTLNARGKKAAPSMGKFLTDVGYVPDQIVSSSATRAKSTTELVRQAIGVPSENVHFNSDLYYSDSEAYLEAARTFNAGTSIGMIVGHNPSVEESILSLCGIEASGSLMMPTAGIACIQIYTPWNEVRKGAGRLKWFMIPRLLEKMG